jgi:alcohol dehydrogenase (quinone), cytochrome c subunit
MKSPILRHGMRWGTAIAFVGIAGVCGLLGVMEISYLADRTVGERNLVASEPSPALIARGEYLAKLGDCAACHSVPGRPPFTGGLRMAIPIGAIYTTNITPDPVNGIGRFSLTDFDRALRFGVADGHSLYPAMPFPSYANTKREDVAALYAYFKYGVAAAATPNITNDIVFPLSMRWPLTFWRLLFAAKPTPFQDRAESDPIVARGAYFVEGLGHCGECHTPRNLVLQVKAQNPSQGSAFLSGAVIENYFAPNLRNAGPDTLGGWSENDIVDFLTTGANPHGIVFGSMSDVVVHSTQYMSREDAVATARYLKTLSEPEGRPARSFAYNETEHQALRHGDASKLGALLYLDNCAACHRPDGTGYDRVFPELAGNPVVEAPNPVSLISIVLAGSQTPRTAQTPAQFTMPAFAWRLSDRDVADLVNFVRSSWGNSASVASVGDVAGVRKALAQPAD